MAREQREKQQAKQPDHQNTVHLVGRLSNPMDVRELPSGDSVGTFRLIVERKPAAGRPHAPRVDTIDCVAWSAGLQRQVRRWGPGDVLEVDGAIRRRFWQANGGAVSRYEVEVTRIRRLADSQV